MSLLKRFFCLIAHDTSILLNNEKAIQKIKNLSVSHKGKPSQTKIKSALNIYRQINGSKNSHCIHELLSLSLKYRKPEIILTIWDDIENALRRETNKIQYSLLLKCLIRSDDIGKFDLMKCISVLKWMTRCNYKLSCTHASLINKLIFKCGIQNDFQSLQYIHQLINRNIIEIRATDINIMTALINSYGECKKPLLSLNIFESISDKIKDSICISATIKSLINNNNNEKALLIYNSYDNQNDICHMLAIKAYTNIGKYDKCQQVYNKLKLKDKLFDINDLKDPSLASDIMILKACSKGSLLHFGKEIHSKLSKNGIINNNVTIQIHLINMYGKCGILDKSIDIFNKSSFLKTEIGIWNAMIRAFGRNNNIISLNKCYYELRSQSELNPNYDTYLILMNAYNHCGDISLAQHLWNNDITDSDIKYDSRILGALMDCMCRNGTLNAVYLLLIKFDIREYKSGWSALLSGCRKLNNIILANQVYDSICTIFHSDAEIMANASTLMSHIFASNNRFDEMNSLRTEMINNGWIHSRGYGKSQIDINGILYSFVSGLLNKNNLNIYNKKERKLIMDRSDELCQKMKLLYNFKHDLSLITKEINNLNDKEKELRQHSEKIALLYGLIKTSKEYQIIINNNLRICNDCHNFMKLASKIEMRSIIISDSNRVHVFRNGECTCNDFY